jgi:hypothetical protein
MGVVPSSIGRGADLGRFRRIVDQQALNVRLKSPTGPPSLIPKPNSFDAIAANPCDHLT